MKIVFDAASDIEAHLIGWVDETRTNKKRNPVLSKLRGVDQRSLKAVNNGPGLR